MGSQSGVITNEQMERNIREIAARANGAPAELTIRCGHCDWSVTAPTAEAQAARDTHLERQHPQIWKFMRRQTKAEIKADGQRAAAERAEEMQLRVADREPGPLEQELLATAGVAPQQAAEQGTRGNEKPPLKVKVTGGRPRQFTEQELIDELKQWIADHGHFPTQMEMTPANGLKSKGVYTRYFGTLANVARACGVDPLAIHAKRKRTTPPPARETSVPQPEPAVATEAVQAAIDAIESSDLRELATGLAAAAPLIRHRAILSQRVRAAIADLLQALSDEIEAAA